MIRKFLNKAKAIDGFVLDPELEEGLIQFGRLIHNATKVAKDSEVLDELADLGLKISAHRVYMTGLIACLGLEADISYNNRKYSTAKDYFDSDKNTVKERQWQAELKTRNLKNWEAANCNLFKFARNLDQTASQFIMTLQTKIKSIQAQRFEPQPA